MEKRKIKVDFDIDSAIECTQSFSSATSLGCCLTLESGEILYETGYCYTKCNICSLGGRDKNECFKSQLYGMAAAERFGGKYIYYCPMGLTCFVSPIIGSNGGRAEITAGPVLMVDVQDYIDYDLNVRLEDNKYNRDNMKKELSNIPVVDPGKLNSYSTILFMAVGFLNKISEGRNLLEAKVITNIQGEIGTQITNLKFSSATNFQYYSQEQKLLATFIQGERKKAHKTLNEILGLIFFQLGNDIELEKVKILDIYMQLSREATYAGANEEQILKQTYQAVKFFNSCRDKNSLCYYVSSGLDKLLNLLFSSNTNSPTRDNVVLMAYQYARGNFSKKISLEEVADSVNLSVSHFCKVFKTKTGETFIDYLNRIRIEKSCQLMKMNKFTLSEITQMVGFEDQSYFSKVFKRYRKETPMEFLKRLPGNNYIFSNPEIHD